MLNMDLVYRDYAHKYVATLTFVAKDKISSWQAIRGYFVLMTPRKIPIVVFLRRVL